MNIDEINKKYAQYILLRYTKFRSKLKTSIRKLIFRQLTCLTTLSYATIIVGENIDNKEEIQISGFYTSLDTLVILTFISV